MATSASALNLGRVDTVRNVFVPGKKLGFEKERFKVVLPEDDGRPPRPGREGQERIFTIDVQFAAEINLHSLQAFCTGQIAQTNSALMSIVAVRLAVLRRCADVARSSTCCSATRPRSCTPPRAPRSTRSRRPTPTGS